MRSMNARHRRGRFGRACGAFGAESCSSVQMQIGAHGEGQSFDRLGSHCIFLRIGYFLFIPLGRS